jgi:hypothetical protein
MELRGLKMMNAIGLLPTTGDKCESRAKNTRDRASRAGLSPLNGFG